MHRLTYVLLILVLGTLGFSLARHRNLTTATIVGQQDREQKDRDHNKKVDERFPTVDYNQLESANPEKNAKKKRYNDGSLVYATARPEIVETVRILEPHPTFPALPAAESDLVVVAQ